MTTYRDVLKQIGWPTRAVVLDFETTFDTDYTLKKTSSIEYVEDPRFDWMSVGLKSLAEPMPGGFEQYFEKPAIVDGSFKRFITSSWFGAFAHNVTWLIQNARFDAIVLKQKFGLVPPFILDLIDIDRQLNPRTPHDLGAMAEAEDLIPKGETVQFKGLTWETMTDDQKQALRDYNLRDCRAEAELFKRKIPLIEVPAVEIPLMRHTLKMCLNPMLDFDFKLAGELVRDMKAEVRVHTIRTGLTETQLRSRDAFNEVLQASLPDGEMIPTKVGAKGPIPALAKDDDGLKWLLGHQRERVRDLVEARVAVRSWPGHVKRVLRLTAQAKALGGKIWMPLKFFGGHTGRWSGDMKINAQNLGGKGRGKANHPLIGAMRRLLMAPPGHSLVVVDLRQIEARMLAWMAGQMDLLQGFTKGSDIYSDFATTLFGHEVREAHGDDLPEKAKILEIERGFGKDGVLGCGYGMGADKFYIRCRANDTLRPLFDSGQYDRELIERLVKTYRTKYSKVPELWRKIEKAFLFVTKYQNRTCTIPMVNGALEFFHVNQETRIRLPSGRTLKYKWARVTSLPEDRSPSLVYKDGPLWGGAIVENIVQAMSRDILAGAILEVEYRGIPVVLHCHDEIVACVPTNRAEEVLKTVTDIMTTNPPWAKDLPLKTEGKITQAYCK